MLFEVILSLNYRSIVGIHPAFDVLMLMRFLLDIFGIDTFPYSEKGISFFLLYCVLHAQQSAGQRRWV